MSSIRQLKNTVRDARLKRGWSQDELARRAGISRAAVSAIEIERLIPSVEAALGLADALGCRVEQLFQFDVGAAPTWAWPPPVDPCRYWKARVGERVLLIPVEGTDCGASIHDGVAASDTYEDRGHPPVDTTLVMASCDPAAGLLATEYARVSGFRLLVLRRSSRKALELLAQGLVDVAGVHLTTARNGGVNSRAIAQWLPEGFSLLTVSQWQDGVALGPGVAAESVASAIRANLRWIGREPGSGARQCQDELLDRRPAPRRMAGDHHGVADAIRHGWADAGVCVRLVAEEARLKFLPAREEAYDVCFRTDMEHDPRVRSLIQVVRSNPYRDRLSDLPGYNFKRGGEVIEI